MPEWANPHITESYMLITVCFLVSVAGSWDLQRKSAALLASQLYSEKPELENGLLAPSQVTLLSGVALFVTNQLFNLAQLGSGSNRTTSTSHKCVCLSGHRQHIIFFLSFTQKMFMWTHLAVCSLDTFTRTTLLNCFSAPFPGCRGQETLLEIRFSPLFWWWLWSLSAFNSPR